MTGDRLRQMDGIEALEFAMKHGPDAARLLADAMDALRATLDVTAALYRGTLSSYEKRIESDTNVRALLARFAALGEPS